MLRKKNTQKVTFFIREPNGKSAIHQINVFVNNLQITAINISVDGSSIYLLYEDPTKKHNNNRKCNFYLSQRYNLYF